MLSRRSFTKLLGALPFVRRPRSAEGENAAMRSLSRTADHRPRQLGILGKTYFNADYPQNRLPAGHTVYLDGREVIFEAFEVDVEGQWCGLYECRRSPDGGLCYTYPRRQFWQFGKVELRKVAAKAAKVKAEPTATVTLKFDADMSDYYRQLRRGIPRPLPRPVPRLP